MEIAWVFCFIAIAIAVAAVVALLIVLNKQHSANHEVLFESRMEQMLTPLKEKLDTFRAVVTQTHALQTKDRADLQAQISQLVSVNQTLGREAHQLSSALKNDNKAQGDWGELHLVTLLEQGGLQQGIHFQVQVTRHTDGTVVRNQSGVLQRPDVIINLPDNKLLVVDAKTSLKAYMEYTAADTAEARQAAIKRHLISVKRHIDELGVKDYPASFSGACSHVLMYIPSDNAYQLAMKADPSLWKYASDRNVAMVTATHLFSVVQLLGQLWRQDAQEKNVMRIAAEGGKLYDKLVVFLAHFSKIEDSLRQLQTRFDEAKVSLSEGKGNLLQKAENMRAMGAKVSKRIPKEMLDLPDDEPE